MTMQKLITLDMRMLLKTGGVTEKQVRMKPN
jgi:hypothetical protein